MGSFLKGQLQGIRAGHHVVVMLIMCAFYFCHRSPCLRLCLLTTPIVEVGTTSYCAFVLWPQRCRGLYKIVMTASNVALLVLIVIVLWNNALSTPVVLLVA